MTAAGNWPESVHAKPKPLAVTKHSRYTLRAEDSFYIHGQKNILALMTLLKAVVLNVSFLFLFVLTVHTMIARAR